jgi:hypothetical protein
MQAIARRDDLVRRQPSDVGAGEDDASGAGRRKPRIERTSVVLPEPFDPAGK